MQKYKGRFTIKKNEEEYKREKDEWKYFTREKDKTSIPGEGQREVHKELSKMEEYV